MKLNSHIAIIIVFLFLCIGCKKEDKPIIISSEEFHASVDKVIEIMIHDIFSPPVASRIFAYPNIAAYEVIANNNNKYNSLSGQLNGLSSTPKYVASNTNDSLNVRLAALIAHIDVSKSFIFSEDRILEFRDSLYIVWEQTNKEQFENAKQYGLKVSEHIKSWLNEDNYNETRTMPKYILNIKDPSKWEPTPLAYIDGIEPHWNKIRPFVLDSAAQFKPIPPPEISLEESSAFYKELIEVYEVGQNVIKNGDESEEVEIARFWDCNPYVSTTRGHYMFAIKKITPGAHWIGITKIDCRKTNSNFEDTVFAYTKTSIAIADAFISCWDEKYRSNLERPETLINKYIDEDWQPILQTPPFPKYTSGHSVASTAASTVLIDIFGDNFHFIDDTEVPFSIPERSFKSFKHASNEAAISRLYGWIHYRSAIELGVKQGNDLGVFINKNLKMKQI